MAAIVRDGVAAGALGFSSSRTLLHRAIDGECVPGTFAAADEMIGIGRVLGEPGRGVLEVASDLMPEDPELSWMETLSRETGRPVTFACLQNDADPEQWRRLLAAAEAAASRGGGSRRRRGAPHVDADGPRARSIRSRSIRACTRWRTCRSRSASHLRDPNVRARSSLKQIEALNAPLRLPAALLAQALPARRSAGL
jgi:N-acyl-D-aspartate/D-glutamate deacylase